MHAYVIVGGQGSGKTTVAKMLTELTLAGRMSLSDIVREELAKEGNLQPDRADQIGMGERLRLASQDNGVLADMAMEKFRYLATSDSTCEAVIVESVWHPDEIKKIIDECIAMGINTTVVALLLADDPEEDEALRAVRVIERGAPGDPTTIVEFMESNYREYFLNRDGGFGPYIEGCIHFPYAYRIFNNGTLESLYAQLKQMVGRETGAEARLRIRQFWK